MIDLFLPPDKETKRRSWCRGDEGWLFFCGLLWAIMNDLFVIFDPNPWCCARKSSLRAGIARSGHQRNQKDEGLWSVQTFFIYRHQCITISRPPSISWIQPKYLHWFEPSRSGMMKNGFRHSKTSAGDRMVLCGTRSEVFPKFAAKFVAAKFSANFVQTSLQTSNFAAISSSGS